MTHKDSTSSRCGLDSTELVYQENTEIFYAYLRAQGPRSLKVTEGHRRFLILDKMIFYNKQKYLNFIGLSYRKNEKNLLSKTFLSNLISRKQKEPQCQTNEKSPLEFYGRKKYVGELEIGGRGK